LPQGEAVQSSDISKNSNSIIFMMTTGSSETKGAVFTHSKKQWSGSVRISLPIALAEQHGSKSRELTPVVVDARPCRTFQPVFPKTEEHILSGFAIIDFVQAHLRRCVSSCDIVEPI
jgi:hypothetical protein